MQDYQIIVDTVSTIMLVSFPIALVFVIGQKLANFFLSFVIGSKRVNL